ncbi:hypothetical protein Efla_006016 [Eimeria flavescens]
MLNISCATQTEPIHIDEEPQYKSSSPSQLHNDDSGALRTSELEEPDYAVAESEIVLRASFEESSQLSEDRHRVIGTSKYTPHTNKAKPTQEGPGLSQIEFLGSSEPISPTVQMGGYGARASH